jgi:hypothetical protein
LSALLTSHDFSLLAGPYNSLHGFENILNLCLQLVENLNFLIIEVEHLAIQWAWVLQSGCKGTDQTETRHMSLHAVKDLKI